MVIQESLVTFFFLVALCFRRSLFTLRDVSGEMNITVNREKYGETHDHK